MWKVIHYGLCFAKHGDFMCINCHVFNYQMDLPFPGCLFIPVCFSDIMAIS